MTLSGFVRRGITRKEKRPAFNAGPFRLVLNQDCALASGLRLLEKLRRAFAVPCIGLGGENILVGSV